MKCDDVQYADWHMSIVLSNARDDARIPAKPAAFSFHDLGIQWQARLLAP
jgi:hypothetical protein